MPKFSLATAKARAAEGDAALHSVLRQKTEQQTGARARVAQGEWHT